MDDWIAFYDSAHSIYVNPRHRDVHFRRIAADIGRYVQPGASVVDYGCGEALHADLIADKAGRLVLVEPAPGVRARLAARFGDNRKIEVAGADRLAALADHSVDLVIMHSVAQYLTVEEFDAVLARFARLLRPTGLLVVGDVIAPTSSALTDAAALLRFGAHDGFFLAALVGLVRTLMSSYWRLRSALGLTRYDAAAMIARLNAAGFGAERAAQNIGHNQARMTFLGRPSGSAISN
jgi:ubiquinone/menaquinone biosynthesis C-methylase UbiE